MQPAKFLKKYDRLVIEPDGVITSDCHFITCAMLSVYEMCNSKDYFGKTVLDYTSVYNNQKQITDLFLSSGKLPVVLSELGVDYPIDIAYILLCAILGIGERRDFSNIYNYFRYIDLHTPDIFDHCATLLGRVLPDKDCKRGGEVWLTLKRCYYEWLYGDELYEMYTEEPFTGKGKPPVILQDSLCQPIISIRDTLSALLTAGKKISLCTLRTRPEVEVSFRRFKLDNIFSHENTVTVDDITEAGHKPNINSPLDPDPYAFARGAVGTSFSETAYEAGEYDELFSRTLIVSSSPTSLFASQALGAGFAAVIRDPLDKSLKDMFRQFEADYVLDSFLDLVPHHK